MSKERKEQLSWAYHVLGISLFNSHDSPVRWVSIPILLQKLREVESLAQGHTVNKWQNWDLNSSESESKACTLSVPLPDGLPVFPEWPRVRLACCPPPEGITHIAVCLLGIPGIVQCTVCENAHSSPAGMPMLYSQQRQQNH